MKRRAASRRPPDGRVGPELRRLCDQDRLLAAPLRVADEVHSSVDAPDRRDCDCQQGLLYAAEAFEGADDVEGEAGKVRYRAEDGHHHVLEAMEHMMLAEGDYTNDVGQTVEQEGSEVRGKSDQQQSVRHRGKRRVRTHPERIPDVMREARDGLVVGRGAACEVEQGRESAKHGGDGCEGPYGAMGSEVAAMEQTEMFWHLLVAAHRVGDPRASVDAAQGRADKRKEDGERLDQHESLAVPAEHRV